MEWREEWEKEDMEKDEKDNVRCWREWRKMVNSILDFIQVTEDCPGANQDSMVPILDLKCRMEEVKEEGGLQYRRIMWRFYEKPMNTKYCIMERSAMSQKVKITTMVQEVIRRCRNHHEAVPEEEVKEVLSKYCLKMKRSGYHEGTRRMVILAGLKGFERMKREDATGVRKMYRKQEEGKERRWAARLKDKADWFKKRGKSHEEDEEEKKGQRGGDMRRRHEEKENQEKRGKAWRRKRLERKTRDK